MKKLKLFALALVASFSLGVLADTKTYTFDDGVVLDNDWTVTTVVPSGGTANCQITQSIGGSFTAKDNNYLGLSYLNKSNIEITVTSVAAYSNITSVSLEVVASDNSKPTFAAYIVDDNGTTVETLFDAVGSKDGFATGGTNKWGSKTVEVDNKTGHLKIVTIASSSGKYAAIDNIVIVHGGSSTPDPQCTSADATFAAASEAIAIAADATNATTTLTFTKGNNTSDATYAVLKGGKATTDAAVANGVFTASAAGTYVVKATQAADGTYCEVVKEVTITVTDNRPAPAGLFEWSKGTGAKVETDNTDLASNDMGTLTVGTSAVMRLLGANAVDNNSKGYKLGNNDVCIEIEGTSAFEEGDIVTISGVGGGAGERGFAVAPEATTNAVADTVLTNLIEESSATKEYVVVLKAAQAGAKLRVFRLAGKTMYISGIKVERPVDDGTVKFDVDKDAVTLNVTPETSNPSATVTFSGKNLTPGTYSLILPNLAGLTVNPQSVTVGNDGKLNAAITLSYASNDDVAAAATQISLTIGEITKSVTVNYSASHAKVYAQSINIEQLVLDNGIHYAIADELTAKGYTYANLNALDSLNDSKTARNEPFLGLKIKTSGGYIKMLLHANDVLRVKFGNLPAAVKVTFNDANEVQHSEGVYEYTATEEVYVKIATSTSGTVVFKQIMINEAIVDVTLPASPEPTALDAVETGKAVKFIENGQIYIIRDGVRYNALGAVVE